MEVCPDLLSENEMIFLIEDVLQVFVFNGIKVQMSVINCSLMMLYFCRIFL